MSPDNVDLPRSSEPPQPPEGSEHLQPSVGADPPGVEKLLHAQDAERVYQAAGDQFILNPGHFTPAAAANTLPRDTATFAGRATELEDLTRNVTYLMANDKPLPVFTIDGMPGVGKSTFVIHVGHQLSPKFPDGQLFVDMRAHTVDKSPAEPTDALRALLTVDGVPARDIANDVDGRSAMWRARMANRRSILIIDNVAGHQQVEPLLPGSSTCLVLVTSRRRLTGLGARYAATSLTLGPLPSDAAIELFTHLAGRSADEEPRETMLQLVELCGRLPLALALLAARLRPEPGWRVETLVEILAAAQDRLAYMRAEDIQVASTFDLSYRSLPSSRRRFFRFLGLNPGADFDTYAVAALAGVELRAARRHLDSLYNDNLVEQPAPGRYRLHDLVGVYTRAHASHIQAPQREQALARLVDYYQHAASIADSFLAARAPRSPDLRAGRFAVPVFTDASQAAAWMNTELPNLLACASYAISDGDDTRLIALSATLATFLRHAGPHRQSVALHRAAATAAERRNDHAAQARSLHHLGVLLGRAGDYPAAIGALSDAQALWRALGDRLGEADALTALGITKRVAGDYSAATNALNTALDLYRELDYAAGQAEALSALAALRWLADDFPAAKEFLYQALVLYNRTGNAQGQADVLLHIGVLHRLRHDYPASIRALQQAASRYSGLGARAGVAHTQFLLGMVRRLAGDYLGATDSLKQALVVYRDIGDRLGLANALKDLGAVQRQTGDNTGAMRSLLDALSGYQDLGHRFGQAGTLLELGMVWHMTGDSARAADDLTAALTLYRSLNNRTGQAEVLNNLGAVLLDAGDALARERFQQALTLARAVHNRLAEAHALEGLARWSLRLQDAVEAAQRFLAALRIFKEIGAPEAAEVEHALALLDVDVDGDGDMR